MTFTIKGKSSLSGFFDFIKKNGFEPQKVNESEMIVEVEVEDDQLSLFESAIAEYISYLLFVKTIKESLEMLPVDNSYKTKFLDEALCYFAETSYWKSLTLILISDYFRIIRTLHIDSFMLFNMKGFKKEIQQYVKNMINLDEEDGVESNLTEIGVQDMFVEVRERLTNMKVDVSQFETIHMRGKGNRLVFQTDSETVVDEESLTSLLNGMLGIQIHGAIEAWEKDIVLFPTIVMIFPVKKVIVHQSVFEEAKESLERVKEMFPQERAVVVQYCDGCDRCDE
ncbi:hypothetical protein SMD22_01740 (plasmid) [Brevibacillus halotolerans]|nr:hypothetical protein SMD22_01740 [Brevibacillus halotolerans]